MSSGSTISEAFLKSCEEISIQLSGGPPDFPSTSVGSFSPTSTFASLYPTPYQQKQFCIKEDSEPVISDAERLSAFYPNATFDFYGVPSAALCVYKSGNAWPVRTGPESQRIIREARGVHGHPMQPVWLELGERVYKLLDKMGVRWTSIDPLAFAEVREESFSPLLLWVGVVPGSLQYELANTAAEAVTKLISEAGFRDVEIGFRESIVTPSIAGPKMYSLDTFNNSISNYTKPFTPTLGLAIAPLKTPSYEGTGALYLRENSKGGRILLLTCAHVARPPPSYPNTGLVRKSSSSLREYIIALGHSGYIRAIQSMMGRIGYLDRSIKDWQDGLNREGGYQEGESRKTTRKRERYLNLIEYAREDMEEIDKFHGEISKYWTVPKDRIIGEVIHVEPISIGVGPQKLTEDWALIALDETKFEWDKFKGNVVYVGTFFPPWPVPPRSLIKYYIPL